MPKKVIMIYDLEGEDSKRIRFNRELFQYKIQSHKGKYNTLSNGVLKNYEKLAKSIVIFDKGFLSKVIKIIKKFGVSCRLYEINKEIK